MKKSLPTLHTLTAAALALSLAVFAGCASVDSDDTINTPPEGPAGKKAAKDAAADEADAGIQVPAAAGIVDGDVKTVRQYVDRVTDANERNNEKAREGDWNYSRPAAGGNDGWY